MTQTLPKKNYTFIRPKRMLTEFKYMITLFKIIFVYIKKRNRICEISNPKNCINKTEIEIQKQTFEFQTFRYPFKKKPVRFKYFFDILH